MTSSYGYLLQVLVKFLFDLSPLDVVGALQKAEQVNAATHGFAFDQVVDKLLQSLGSVFKVFFLERPLSSLVGHRWDLGDPEFT